MMFARPEGFFKNYFRAFGMLIRIDNMIKYDG